MGERGLFPFILPLLACLHNSFLKGETCINWLSTSIPSYVVLDVCWWEAQKLMVVYLCRNWVYFTFAYKSVVSITRSSITLLLNPSRAKVNLTCYFHAFSSFPSPCQLWYFLSIFFLEKTSVCKNAVLNILFFINFLPYHYSYINFILFNYFVSSM